MCGMEKFETARHWKCQRLRGSSVVREADQEKGFSHSRPWCVLNRVFSLVATTGPPHHQT